MALYKALNRNMIQVPINVIPVSELVLMVSVTQAVSDLELNLHSFIEKSIPSLKMKISNYKVFKEKY